MSDQLDLEKWIVENRSQTDLEDWLASKQAAPVEVESAPAGELVTDLQPTFERLTRLSSIMRFRVSDETLDFFSSIGAQRIVDLNDAVLEHASLCVLAALEGRTDEADSELRRMVAIISEVREHANHYRAQLNQGVPIAELIPLLHASARVSTVRVPF